MLWRFPRCAHAGRGQSPDQAVCHIRPDHLASERGAGSPCPGGSPSVYSNFTNKDDVFLALLDRSWERRARWVRRAVPGKPEIARALDGDPASIPSVVDRQWTLVSTEFSFHAIRRLEVAVRLVEHEVKVRSELAVLLTEALEHLKRAPVIPVDQLARMIVPVTEGADIQALTDEAAGMEVRSELGIRAVAGLLQHFSFSNE